MAEVLVESTDNINWSTVLIPYPGFTVTVTDETGVWTNGSVTRNYFKKVTLTHPGFTENVGNSENILDIDYLNLYSQLYTKLGNNPDWAVARFEPEAAVLLLDPISSVLPDTDVRADLLSDYINPSLLIEGQVLNEITRYFQIFGLIPNSYYANNPSEWKVRLRLISNSAQVITNFQMVFYINEEFFITESVYRANNAVVNLTTTSHTFNRRLAPYGLGGDALVVPSTTAVTLVSGDGILTDLGNSQYNITVSDSTTVILSAATTYNFNVSSVNGQPGTISGSNTGTWTFNFVIPQPPTIEPIDNVVLMSSTSINYTVTPVINGADVVRYYKNGVEIPSFNLVLQPSTTDSYTVVASNATGTVSRTFSIRVYRRPEVIVTSPYVAVTTSTYTIYNNLTVIDPDGVLVSNSWVVSGNPVVLVNNGTSSVVVTQIGDGDYTAVGTYTVDPSLVYLYGATRITPSFIIAANIILLEVEYNYGYGWLPYSAPLKVRVGNYLAIRVEDGRFVYVSGPARVATPEDEFSKKPVGTYLIDAIPVDVAQQQILVEVEVYDIECSTTLDGKIDEAFRRIESYLKTHLNKIWFMERIQGKADYTKPYVAMLSLMYSILVYLYHDRTYKTVAEVYEHFCLDTVRHNVACLGIDIDSLLEEFCLVDKTAPIYPGLVEINTYLTRVDGCECFTESKQSSQTVEQRDLVTTSFRDDIVTTNSRDNITT